MKELIIDDKINNVEQNVTNKIKEKGFKIFSIKEKKKEADAVNLKINDTKLIIFGNPKVGTLLMQQNDLITFELPIKILLIATDDGKTKFIYRDPNDFPGSSQLNKDGKKIISNMTKLYLEIIDAC